LHSSVSEAGDHVILDVSLLYFVHSTKYGTPQHRSHHSSDQVGSLLLLLSPAGWINILYRPACRRSSYTEPVPLLCRTLFQRHSFSFPTIYLCFLSSSFASVDKTGPILPDQTKIAECYVTGQDDGARSRVYQRSPAPPGPSSSITPHIRSRHSFSLRRFPKLPIT